MDHYVGIDVSLERLSVCVHRWHQSCWGCHGANYHTGVSNCCAANMLGLDHYQDVLQRLAKHRLVRGAPSSSPAEGW